LSRAEVQRTEVRDQRQGVRDQDEGLRARKGERGKRKMDPSL